MFLNETDVTSDLKWNEWRRYQPHDAQYVHYYDSKPGLIGASIKVFDVYDTFADARASLLFSFKESFGDLAADNNELSKLNVVAMLLKDAILKYAMCEDLSWQVPWYYYKTRDVQHLFDKNYSKMASDCKYGKLKGLLETNKSDQTRKSLLSIIEAFHNLSDIQQFRTLYNNFKHNGTIYITGLGGQDSTLAFSLAEKEIKLLSRDEYSIDQLRKMIWKYHCEFEKYFDSIIKEIFPLDFCTNNSFTALEGIKAAECFDKIQNTTSSS